MRNGAPAGSQTCMHYVWSYLWNPLVKLGDWHLFVTITANRIEEQFINPCKHYHWSVRMTHTQLALKPRPANQYTNIYICSISNTMYVSRRVLEMCHCTLRKLFSASSTVALGGSPNNVAATFLSIHDNWATCKTTPQVQIQFCTLDSEKLDTTPNSSVKLFSS